jgi:hypothetical protein
MAAPSAALHTLTGARKPAGKTPAMLEDAPLLSRACGLRSWGLRRTRTWGQGTTGHTLHLDDKKVAGLGGGSGQGWRCLVKPSSIPLSACGHRPPTCISYTLPRYNWCLCPGSTYGLSPEEVKKGYVP